MRVRKLNKPFYAFANVLNNIKIFSFAENVAIDSCNPSPCGSNTECNNGECACQADYYGDPYIGCRPECTISSDCDKSKICVNKKCINPCPDTCGSNAMCDVVNHIPMCSCPPGYTGNSFVSCHLTQGIYKLITVINNNISLKNNIIIEILLQLFYLQTHVTHHHVDQIVNVRKSIA